MNLPKTALTLVTAGHAPECGLHGRRGECEMLDCLVADVRPLICVVDDAQWLDQASARAPAFVARHLATGPAAMIFALRQPADDQGLAGLPEFQLGGLTDAGARTLLDSVLIGPLEDRVRDQVICRGTG